MTQTGVACPKQEGEKGESHTQGLGSTPVDTQAHMSGNWTGREAVEVRDNSPHALEERTLLASRQGSSNDCRGISERVQGSRPLLP